MNSFTRDSPSRRWASGGEGRSDERHTEASKFKLHAKMLLQTSRIALETRDADKLRGAKVRVLPCMSIVTLECIFAYR